MISPPFFVFNSLWGFWKYVFGCFTLSHITQVPWNVYWNILKIIYSLLSSPETYLTFGELSFGKIQENWIQCPYEWITEEWKLLAELTVDVQWIHFGQESITEAFHYTILPLCTEWFAYQCAEICTVCWMIWSISGYRVVIYKEYRTGVLLANQPIWIDLETATFYQVPIFHCLSYQLRCTWIESFYG